MTGTSEPRWYQDCDRWASADAASRAALAVEVERLTAEVERLRYDVEAGKAYRRLYGEAKAERDHLRAEVERLTQVKDAALAEARAERDRALATIARVESLAAEHWDWKAGQVIAQRLRAALAATDEQRCGDWPAPCNCDDPVNHGGHK